MPELSLAIMVILLFSLIKIYMNLEHTRPDVPANHQIATYPVFSIYLGWITVATIANTVAVPVHLDWNGDPLTETIRAIIMVSVAIAMGFIFLL